MIQRPQLQQLKERLAGPRKFMQVLFGPRQVGKTTLVKQLLADWQGPSHFAAADGEAASDVYWLKSQWEILRVQGEGLLVIDEIQKIPNWSETVKQLWDEDSWQKRPIKVVLLGSSRMLLQQGLSESMAGRFETTYMTHWSLSEMEAAFGWDADTYVYYGGYPGPADLITDELRWTNYLLSAIVETSVSRDILMLTRIDKPSLMKRLFELGCSFSGRELSFTKMMGQLQDAGNTVTLAHYLELLDKAGLLAGLQKYAGSAARKRASSPKFQVHNNALLSALQGDSFQQCRANPAIWGQQVESAIGAHLMNESLRQSYRLYYWRDGDAEVDYVLERGRQLVAIEVKTNHEASTAGLAAFSKAHKPHRQLIVGEGGMPWQDFLQLNPAKLFD
ncbi:MAG: ATP-binding protein [Bacteroidia bacterium]